MENEMEPIPMLIWCPECGGRHIDEGEFATKPHHTHACQHCGHCWRPALIATCGVQFLPGFKNSADKSCYPAGIYPEQERAMNKQFTASEVRDIAWSLDGLSRQMLRAYADLLEAQAQPQTDGLHPATAELVDRFSDALREKLLEAQRKYGYSDNWQRSDWMDGCRQQLREHLAKGDPRDVAAYCAFLWHHGESTTQAQPHDLIKTGDPDAAPSICDANGEVVLAYCRRCKQGEGDLTESCPAQPPAASATPNLASYWRIVAEAAEVLQMVLDSGVKLPPNWRGPLLDELSGLSAMMLAAQENPQWLT